MLRRLAQPGLQESDAAKIHGVNGEKAGAVTIGLQIIYEVRPVGGIGNADHRAERGSRYPGCVPPAGRHESAFPCLYDDPGCCRLGKERIFLQIRMVDINDLGKTSILLPVKEGFLIGGIDDDLFVTIVLGDKGMDAEVVDMEVGEYSATAEIHFDKRFAVQAPGDGADQVVSAQPVGFDVRGGGKDMVHEVGEDVFEGLFAQEGARFVAIVGDAVDEILHAHFTLVGFDHFARVSVLKELGSPCGCLPGCGGVGDDDRLSWKKIFVFELFVRKVATAVNGNRFVSSRGCLKSRHTFRGHIHVVIIAKIIIILGINRPFCRGERVFSVPVIDN